jgi:general secretion pathway protein C
LSFALPGALQGIVSSLSNIPQRSWQQGICAVLLLWLVSGLADMAWLMLAPADKNEAAAVPASALVGAARPVSTQVDIAGLQSLNLFGNADKAQSPVMEPIKPATGIEDQAAKTKLDLKLQGLVYSDNSAESRAMIAYKNKEDQYGIGDKLPLANRVTLAKVLIDRVILDNNGRYEVLWLYDKSNKSSMKTVPVSKVRVAGRNTKASVLASDYRQRVYKDPRSLAEVVRLSPARRGGQMLGYRVSPGRDKQQFVELGFKPNDIITAVNSITLDNPSKAVEVYKIMQEAQEASFEILRGDETLQIVVSMQGESE